MLIDEYTLCVGEGCGMLCLPSTVIGGMFVIVMVVGEWCLARGRKGRRKRDMYNDRAVKFVITQIHVPRAYTHAQFTHKVSLLIRNTPVCVSCHAV